MFIRAEQAKTSDRGLTPVCVDDRMKAGRPVNLSRLGCPVCWRRWGSFFHLVGNPTDRSFTQSEKRPSDISDSRKSAHQIVGKTTVSYRSKNNRVIDSAIAPSHSAIISPSWTEIRLIALTVSRKTVPLLDGKPSVHQPENRPLIYLYIINIIQK